MVVAELFKETPKETTEPSFAEVAMSVTIVIPAAACGLIIGKGGERINLLREQTQCKIMLQSKEKAVPGLNERTVAITGNLLNAQMAVEKIVLLIFDDGTVHYENQGTNYAGFAPVARGNSISQGLPSTVAGLSFMPQSHPGLHPAALQLPIGYEFAAHAAAAAYGLQQTPQQHFSSMDSGAGQVQMRLSVPELAVGVLVGKGGISIKELMSLSGASIKVSQKGEVVPGTTNRIVTISGNPVAANYAHMLVLQKVPNAAPIS
jgi:RNA-binding protein Nova